jgi:hypothetical protein
MSGKRSKFVLENFTKTPRRSLRSRGLNPLLLHANNLIRVVERKEFLTLPAAVLYAPIVLPVLFAELRPHESGVCADIDSP